ncbi:unnamed protein product [Paramecium sonneborni]|uniref:PH domain-containing protein n=1 Tax=Paramecium sonneborni TaxID=65129 RepID=A0A8S1PLG0_9CILI|nr:unnamed protein product [Paramecium sonneborni]
MFQDVISEFRNFYTNQNLTYQDFSSIIDQFAKLDVRCILEEQIKKQLYDFILDKQDGLVTYPTVETLVFEFLLQQDVPQNYNTNLKTLGVQAQRLPQDMLQTLTNEFLQQFKNFYKLVENKYGIDVEYKELETLAKELQRTIKINSIEILRYIRPLVDENEKVQINEFLQLCNDLERIIIDQHTYQTNGESKNPYNEDQINNNKNQHFSSDEENKSITHMPNVLNEQKDFANTVYQQTDIILQKKYVNQQGKQLLNEVNQTVKKMEAQISILQDQIKEKDKKIEILYTENNKKIEQFLIEKELAQSQLEQFESEIQNKDQQIQMLLQDTDFFQEEMNRVQEQCIDLKQQLKDYHDQLQSITKIETELKEVQIDNKQLNEQLSKSQSEINRLTQNNKSLMKIIEEFESKQNLEDSQVQVVIKDQNQEMIIHYEERLHELQLQYQSLEEVNVTFQKQQSGYEQQIIELKREINYYKKLYENLNCENQQLRSSIMPRPSAMGKQFNLGALGRFSKVSIFPSSKIGIINRFSNTRMPSIQQNPQTIYSNFNPLDDICNGGLKIIEQDEPEQQDFDQQEADQEEPDQQKIQVNSRRNQKFQQLLVESIVEETEIEKDSTNIKVEPNNQNQLMQNFDKFWGGLKNKNLKESIFDPQTIQIDEKILFQKDFLGIRNDQKVKELLRIENNVHKSIIQKCFSDSVYRIDSKGKRARRIIFITEHTFYAFQGETKPGKLSRNFSIKDIKALIFSESSPVVCCIKVAGSDDYLIETFKRTELNIYLTEIFNSQRMMLYNLEFSKEFKIKFKGLSDPINMSQVSKKQGYLDQGKTSAFKVSTKQGWLWLMKSNFLIQDNWKEIFVILTNVGLILFKKPGDFQPILFISLVDAIVIKDPILETNKKNLLKIRYENSEYEYLLSATSALLKDEWHDIIQQTIMEQVRQQMKQSNCQMERSRTQIKQEIKND